MSIASHNGFSENARTVQDARYGNDVRAREPRIGERDVERTEQGKSQ